MKKRQEVFDLYWYFACERQNIFWKKFVEICRKKKFFSNYFPDWSS